MWRALTVVWCFRRLRASGRAHMLHSPPKLFAPFHLPAPQIDVHVDSSIIASQITKLCRSNTKRLVCDIGLLLQGESPGEPPEIMGGAFQMRYPDCDFAQLPEELVSGRAKAKGAQAAAAEAICERRTYASGRVATVCLVCVIVCVTCDCV